MVSLDLCRCIPIPEEKDCDINSPTYEPVKCELNPKASEAKLLGCNWFIKSVTDTSYPDIDFVKGGAWSRIPKAKDGDECLDENGEVRKLGKFDSGNVYGAEFYPSASFNFYTTPFTNVDDPEGLIYWIQSNERQTKCPTNSWLAFSEASCESGASFIDIDTVALPEKSLWKLNKVYATDFES